jgi:hypothetical protein
VEKSTGKRLALIFAGFILSLKMWIYGCESMLSFIAFRRLTPEKEKLCIFQFVQKDKARRLFYAEKG